MDSAGVSGAEETPQYGIPANIGPCHEGQGARTFSYSNETIETEDSWHISVHHFLPEDRTSDVPVAMLPGLGMTSWTFYGGARGGIVSALLQAGREVWLLDARGVGASIPAGGKGLVRMADKLTLDLPAFLDHILGFTEGSGVDMVGHGIGGVLIYLYALLEQHPSIRRAVTISAPLRLSHSTVPLPLRGWTARQASALLGRIPLTRLADRLWGRAGSRPIPAYFDDPANQPELVEAFLEHGIADICGGELSELLTWISVQDLRALAPVRDRYTGKRRLGFPVRFLVGADDPVTPPQLVFEAFDSLGGPQKDFRVIGRAHGYSRDYRHVDILLGDQVCQDVAPLVVDWLG